jgi:hypothetical protein
LSQFVHPCTPNHHETISEVRKKLPELVRQVREDAGATVEITCPPRLTISSAFSSLLIGNLSSTFVIIVFVSFSSLLIGNHSSTALSGTHQRLHQSLSVPSSSGITLQPAERADGRGWRIAFSSLLIGNHSSTAFQTQKKQKLLNARPRLFFESSLSAPNSSRFAKLLHKISPQ